MEKIENAVYETQVTRTDLSDWSGAPPEFSDPLLETVAVGEDRVAIDNLDYAKRGFDLLTEGYGIGSLSYGPASAPLSLYHPIILFKNSSLWKSMTKYYEGIAYDSIEFRITTSNPKGLAGCFVTGIYPHSTWNNVSFDQERTYFDQNQMCRQHLMLSPQSQLVNYSEAKDIVFDVPWQYNVPYLPTNFILNYSDSSATQQLWPGTPVLYFVNINSRYVSTQSLPAQIRVFVRFQNLRFSGPRAIDGAQALVFEAQSGVEPLIPMLAVAAVDAVTDIGSEILTDIVPRTISKGEDIMSKGSYEMPQAVQLAYVGDSTKYGPPSNFPIFRPLDGTLSKHPVIDFLRQPQFIETMTTPAINRYYYGNPTSYEGSATDLSGNDQPCTYFRYFSQACSYWRGTLIYDFVFSGHPMVEVLYNFQIQYPPFSNVSTADYSTNSVLKGVCNGVHVVSVPMPFMTPFDHMRIVDQIGTTNTTIKNNSTAVIVMNAIVVSTMLSAAPVIPVSVFIRAGEDFEFLQPYAVGLGYVQHPADNLTDLFENAVELVRDREIIPSRLVPTYGNLDLLADLEAQVNLPPTSIVFETRAKAQKSTNQMMALTNVEDFMQIWSRALPYQNYNGDMDPIVELKYGITPYWYPQADTTTAHTLGGVNSWWVTNDYVSYFSSMFLYYKGSIGFKVLCKPGTGYKYITLTAGDTLRAPGRSTFTSVVSQLPPEANLAYGSVATDLSGQPVLEATIPLRSNLKWAFCNRDQMKHVLNGFYDSVSLSGDIRTNVVLHQESSDLEDALYRKAGGDFTLAVRSLLPPPTLWMAKGNNWS